MEQASFDAMVARLERESAEHPRAYQLKVALLALLGFAILLVIVGFAGLGLLLLAGAAVALLLTGGKAIILILKLGKVLFLLAVPLWFLVKASLASLFTRIPAPEGTPVSRADAPALFEALDRLRQKMGGPRFHHVLVVDDMTAWMTQRPLFGLFGWPRNYLGLGLPMLESLSPREALAVVAHEYGHLAGSHARFGAFIYRLRRTWVGIQEATAGWHGWASRPVQRIVAWYAPYFNAYTFVLARANEYEADAASARLLGADVAASALKRSNVAGAQYEAFLETTFGAIRDAAAPPKDLSVRWAAQASAALPRDLASEWLGKALEREPAALDTHPALQQRLKALGADAATVSDLPPPVAGPTAAVAWFGATADALREQFQAEWQRRVGTAWRERHEAIQQRKRRLAELRAIESPNVDAQLERLRLQIELEPAAGDFDAVVAFNASHPDQPLGVFMEGDMRLDRGDETGLAMLERAMTLDADAIKPACQRAFAFLKQRRDERAEGYAARWRERDLWEITRTMQFRVPDPKQELQAPAGLAPEVVERVLQIVRLERKGVGRAWFARRVLPVDPSLVTYVLAIEPGWWSGLTERPQRIVDRLAAHEWPLPVQICTLGGNLKPWKGKLKRLQGARVPFRPKPGEDGFV